ncbi:hypothetical protein C8R45DRAFT_1189305 [Mycena sanguinolenta]|nr:hypothetical protein C8R45DRAFT_1189305 [Mycena sanguinolenta]
MNENTEPQKHIEAARMQLISPPPEEELQRTHVFGFPRTNTNAAMAQTKRKRASGVTIGSPSKTSADPVEATPNPKPRKAHRRRTSTLESPSRPSFAHAQANPNADYVPPVTLTAPHGHGRRSASMTPYEPPPDVFTPPREVLLAPPPSSTRKAAPKQKTKQKEKERTATPRARTQTPLRVVVHSVKKEPPPSIDRTRPMTPPSPTDDPLLLLPSSSPVKVNRTRKRSVPVPIFDEDEDEDGVRSSDAAYAPIDWTAGLPLDLDAPDAPSSDSMDLDMDPAASFDGPLPVTLTLPLSVPLAAAAASADYDYDSYANAGWDSSDDDEGGDGDALPTTTMTTTTALAATTLPLGAASSLDSLSLSGTPTRPPPRTSTRIRSATPTTSLLPPFSLAQHTPTPVPTASISTNTTLPTTPAASTPSLLPNTTTPSLNNTNAGLTVNDFLHPTKPDPPTPRTLARAEAWGVWGSPWPGRGPHDGESSFRMDGLGRERDQSVRAWGTAPPVLGGSEGAWAASALTRDPTLSRDDTAGPARVHVNDGEGEQEEEHQEEEEEDSADEGVSFLRALREEDARERERLRAGQGVASLSRRRVSASGVSTRVRGASMPPASRLSVPPRRLQEQEQDEEEGGGEQEERANEVEEEEEEVRAMSVDPVEASDDERPNHAQGVDEDEDEEMHSTASRVNARAFAFPSLSLGPGSGSTLVPQTPPARRAPRVPARSERVVGRVVERAPAALSVASLPLEGGGTSGQGGEGEDVRMPHHSEAGDEHADADHPQDHPHSRNANQNQPTRNPGEGGGGDAGEEEGGEDEDEETHENPEPKPNARRTTPPVLVGLGTHVVVPPSPSPRKRRGSFMPVDPGDVELPDVRPHVRAGGHIRAGVQVEVDGEDVEVDVDTKGQGEGEGGESGDEDEAEAALLGLVKITSADPRAAARAAAILKQHDYDCFTRLRLNGKGRRHSYAGVTKSKSVGSAGAVKGKAKEGMQDLVELRAAYDRAKTPPKARHSMGGKTKTPARVVGEHVYFPGSPAPVTTVELLAEAEREVSVSMSAVSSISAAPSASTATSTSHGAGISVSLAMASPSARARQAMDRDTNRRASARGVPLPESDDESDSAHEDEEEHRGMGREWTKAEWKALDACFTDERIEVARRMGMVLNVSPAPGPSTPVRQPSLGGNDIGDDAPVVMMASADAVDLGAVVARFVKMVGGEEVVKGWGAAWEMDRLTQYARALQNKQRAGHVAPPTPSTSTSAHDSNAFASERRRASMAVPDFTPLGKRAMPPRASGGGRAPMSALSLRSPSPLGNGFNTSISRARLPPPLGVGAPFSNLPPTPEPARRRRVPGSLFAPRYSHLLEEAVAVSRNEREPEEEQDDVDGDVSLESEEQLEEQEQQEQEQEESSFDSSVDGEDAEMVPATPLREREARLEHPVPAPATTTIGNRVKGFLFSYLPIAKTAPPPTRKAPLHAGPRLPLPPLELLEKPRGPVKTPARPPLPKTRAPKELVNLNPAPPPKQKSLLPRRAPTPKRLVDLQHIEPPVEAPTVPFVPRPRTASGGSVKDLVKNFEAKTQSANTAPQVKRVRSVGDFGGRNNNNKRPGTATGGAVRPMWRP